MTTLLTEPPRPQDLVASEPPPRADERTGRWALGAVTAVALAIYTWGLSRNGLGNTYYSAAVRGMSHSWHDFFFAAFDPGGFISVDKPPVALWMGALSVRVFGYSSWSLLLPSALAGAATVALLWCIVRRRFGVAAATVAGLVMALSPISAAVNRLNLPEPFMILFMVASAWAVLRALDSARPMRWLVLAGAFVGLGFNTKMLAALIMTPALALAVILGTSGWATRLRRVAVLAGTSLAFSLPWMVIVDLWPASSRPYVGGSTNNTVRNLVFGYNGIGRVDGSGQLGGGGGGRAPFGKLGGPGGVFGGGPGWLRMFSDAVGGQIGWLLPLAALAGIFALWFWRRDRTRLAAVALWGGWLVLYFVIFSNAKGIFHSYYTSAMVPAVGALVGIGGAAAWRAMSKRSDVALLAGGAIAVTAWVQWVIARRAPSFHAWARWAMVLLVVVAVMALVALSARTVSPRRAGGALAISLAGLLVIPGAWTLSETTSSTLNATLPQAGPRGGASGGTFGSAGFDEAGGEAQLAEWLKSRRAGERWDLVTTSAMSASSFEAEYGLSVMALGGFLGSDPASTPERFAQQVALGQVRFVLEGGGPGGGRFPGGGAAPNGGGFPGGGRFPGNGGQLPVPGNGQFPNGGGGGFPGNGRFPGGGGGGGGGGPAGGFGRGTSASILSLAQEYCPAVTSASAGDGFPASYDGLVLDCKGVADQLLVGAATTS
jgi:4-amino-4-deoxy-L-arabinose transferase-like glycosyltransferase